MYKTMNRPYHSEKKFFTQTYIKSLVLLRELCRFMELQEQVFMESLLSLKWHVIAAILSCLVIMNLLSIYLAPYLPPIIHYLTLLLALLNTNLSNLK